MKEEVKLLEVVAVLYRHLFLGADAELGPSCRHICNQSHASNSLSWASSSVLQGTLVLAGIMLCVWQSNLANEKGRSLVCDAFRVRDAFFRRKKECVIRTLLRGAFSDVCE